MELLILLALGVWLVLALRSWAPPWRGLRRGLRPLQGLSKISGNPAAVIGRPGSCLRSYSSLGGLVIL